MSNIDTYLATILSARYGRDVRQSIHDAIQESYNSASDAGLSAAQAILNDYVTKFDTMLDDYSASLTNIKTRQDNLDAYALLSSGVTEITAANCIANGVINANTIPYNSVYYFGDAITSAAVTNLPVYGVAQTILTYIQNPNADYSYGAVQISVCQDGRVYIRMSYYQSSTSSVWSDWIALAKLSEVESANEEIENLKSEISKLNSRILVFEKAYADTTLTEELLDSDGEAILDSDGEVILATVSGLSWYSLVERVIALEETVAGLTSS